MSVNFLPAPRPLFFILFLFCSLMMGVGFIMQYAMGLEPCPLCMTQRVFIVLTGFFALLAGLHNPAIKGIKIYGTVVLLSAVAGGTFAIRQLWLQSLPEDKVPACGPGLSYMLETFPLMDTLAIMLRGDGNCAEVVWTFLGLSIPGWTLVCFILLALAGVYQMVRKF